jgi:hypothetical protein
VIELLSLFGKDKNIFCRYRKAHYLCSVKKHYLMKKLFALLMVSATLFVVACNNATEEAATEEVVTEEVMEEEVAEEEVAEEGTEEATEEAAQ